MPVERSINPSVVCIEWDKNIQLLLKEIIGGMDDIKINPSEIDCISTPHSAQAYFQQQPPDRRPRLIILDLPGSEEFGGLTLLEKLKAKDSPNKDTPITIITADVRPEVKRKCIKLGAAHVIEKPFEITEIEDVVREAFIEQP